MAKSTKQRFTVDQSKKLILSSVPFENLTESEVKLVGLYINAGCKFQEAKKNPWNKASIKKWLSENKGDKEVQQFEDDLDSIGWVKARTNFFAKYGEETKAQHEKKSKATKGKKKVENQE